MEGTTMEQPKPEPVKAEIVPAKQMPTGLDSRGKFAKGNKLGGNPYTSEIQKFQRCVLTSIKQKELRDVMRAMLKRAVEGDVNAAKLILERLCGKMDLGTQVNVTNVNPNTVTICIKQEDENDEEQQAGSFAKPIYPPAGCTGAGF